MPPFSSSASTVGRGVQALPDASANVADDQAALADLLSLCRLSRPLGATLLECLDQAQAFAAARAVSLALVGLVAAGVFTLI